MDRTGAKAACFCFLLSATTKRLNTNSMILCILKVIFQNCIAIV